MYSHENPNSDQVLADLGAPFVQAFVDAVDGSRDDYAAFRSWQPGWFPSFTSRFTANFLHERIWDRLVRAVGETEGVHVVDREPIRELRSGTQYLIRLKRHHPGDRIAAYPTEASSAFWANSVLTLDGLESFSLALGYMWDAELRAVGEAVLSFRNGKDNPVWAIRLRRDSDSATGFAWSPVAPDLPEIDLSGVIREAEEESGT
ncbi:hypothetical protein [Salinibacterium sp.]|uniref:hypothetical protein n=1 Tax=Salinibacterium sp. TaxID=1915057 RepID=UPI00286BD9EA|nr:hypothetical protein [Salinibacterium sp.]